MDKIRDFKDNNPILYLVSGVLIIFFSVIFSAYPIAMIVVGATSLDKCPIEPYIPVWLVVSGSIAIFLLIVIIMSIIFQFIKPNAVVIGLFSLIIGIIGLFQFAWFITGRAGNVWVYSKNGKIDYIDPTSVFYCDQTLYLFAFWSITVSYILFAVSIIASTLIIIYCFIQNNLIKTFKKVMKHVCEVHKKNEFCECNIVQHV
ncbi:hypothetical protein BpHYR1_011306 [Brachionus plicatilis]|uniref:Uncharacterized protein n=1 Tax=Brachionus plicatilis TaxID=10195 RepID=A0A3M7S0Y8_BRAPC|nr:hypothetical protein BpHYR1_011306 [Brachionus plicatilis]